MVGGFCLLRLSAVTALVATSLFFLAAPSRSHDKGARSTSFNEEHHLRLYHTHTGERLDIVYRRGDTFLPEAEDQLDHLLRDHRTGEVKPYDPQVFVLRSDLAAYLGRPTAEIDIIFAYPTT